MRVLDRAKTAYVEFEVLLIDELVAGNAIASTPMAACGRVAFGMACAVARDLIKRSSAVTEQPVLT
jgi:hypothetical protein